MKIAVLSFRDSTWIEVLLLKNLVYDLDKNLASSLINKKNTDYVEKTNTELKYKSGYIEYTELNAFLRQYLNADIYIRGHHKYHFLIKKFQELTIQAIVGNTESLNDRSLDPPDFKNEISLYLYYQNIRCSQYVKLIFDWE